MTFIFLDIVTISMDFSTIMFLRISVLEGNQGNEIEKISDMRAGFGFQCLTPFFD